MIPNTWAISVDEETGILAITIDGEMTCDEFRQYLSIFFDIPMYRNSEKNLFDLRRVAESRPRSSRASRTLSAPGKHNPRFPLRSAWI